MAVLLGVVGGRVVDGARCARRRPVRSGAIGATWRRQCVNWAVSVEPASARVALSGLIAVATRSK